MASESEANTAEEYGKTFDISCPHCGETLLGGESIAGMNVECPYCSKTFTAPAVSPELSTLQRVDASEEEPEEDSEEESDDASEEEPEEDSEEESDDASEEESGNGHSLSDLFNEFSGVLYTVALVYFALRVFAGVRFLPKLLVFSGVDWTFAVIFATGVFFDCIAMKSSLLVRCFCVASGLFCSIIYYYETEQSALEEQSAPMDLKTEIQTASELVDWIKTDHNQTQLQWEGKFKGKMVTYKGEVDDVRVGPDGELRVDFEVKGSSLIFELKKSQNSAVAAWKKGETHILRGRIKDGHSILFYCDNAEIVPEEKYLAVVGE